MKKLAFASVTCLLTASCSMSSSAEQSTLPVSSPPVPLTKPTPAPTPKITAPRLPKKTVPPPPRKPKKVLYLTFDDGPSSYTTRLLAILAAYKAKATFFYIGENVKAYPALAKEVVAKGHSVQNHSMHHDHMPALYSGGRLTDDLAATNGTILLATGKKPTCVRPTFGDHSAGTDRVIRKLGMEVVLWDADSEDWQTPGIAKIKANIMRGVKPGATLLFHDGGGDREQTLKAVKQLIPELQKKGYTFELRCR